LQPFRLVEAGDTGKRVVFARPAAEVGASVAMSTEEEIIRIAKKMDKMVQKKNA
ncbi:UNVERIFIED_CONTAM: hypothetical protein K2H54_045016, partial [Gekko kuhli]